MKSLFLFCLVLMSFFSTAQESLSYITDGEFNDYRDYYYSESKADQALLKENLVRERVSIHHGKNNKQSKTVEKFDQEANLISRQYFDREGKLTSESTYEYNSENLLTKSMGSYKGRESKALYTYDSQGRITEIHKYSAKGKYAGRKNTYDANGKIKSALLFKSADATAPYKRLEYTYYEDLSLKSILYFEGEKLKYTWSYDCKPEGEMVGVKSTDTTRICIKEETDKDGNRVVWRQEFNEKGEPEKVKSVFDKDSTRLLTEWYNVKGQLYHRAVFFKDGGQLGLGFDKKGNVISTFETVYNTNQKMVKESRDNSRWNYTRWYSYSDDLVSSYTYMSKRVASVTEYQYVYFN